MSTQRGETMGDRKKQQAQPAARPEFLPEFDVALWGYDRQQVDQCLADMTTRLEEAFRQLDSVETLQTQLCEAHVEIGQLRMAVEERPGAAERLSKVMFAAEVLRRQAAEEADAIRDRAHSADGVSTG